MISNIITFLQEDKIILHPTDTVWRKGCDATSEDAVKKIYKLEK
ncbi:Sua5/YciO/YrdC/YwlC family protein [Seonamhaeicola maritimus]